MRQQHSLILPYLALASAMMLSGSISVIGKLTIAVYPVMLGSVLNLGLSSLILIIVTLLRKKEFPVLKGKALLVVFLQGAIGVVLFRIAFLYGLYWSSAVASGVMICMVPVIFSVLAYVFLGERFNMIKTISVCLTISGLLILHHFDKHQGVSEHPVLGTGLILLAVFCEAAFTIVRRYYAKEVNISPYTTTLYVSIISMLLFLPFSLQDLVTFHYSALSFQQWFPILFSGIVVNIFTFVLWFYGVDHVEASVAGIFTAFMPTAAVMSAVLVLHEPFTKNMMLGATLIMAGVLCMTCLGQRVGKPVYPELG